MCNTEGTPIHIEGKWVVVPEHQWTEIEKLRAENEKLRAKIEDYRTELICMGCEWVKEDEEALRELQRLGQEWDNDDAEQRHGANVADQRHGCDDG